MSENAPSENDQRMARVIGTYIFGGVLIGLYTIGVILLGMANVETGAMVGLALSIILYLNPIVLLAGFIASIRLALQSTGHTLLFFGPSLLWPVMMIALLFYIWIKDFIA